MTEKVLDKTHAQASRSKADTRIMLRMPAETRSIIDSAARYRGKTRTEFMRDAAREEAVKTLLETLFVRLDERQTEELEAILANPPEPNEALRSLLAKPTPWN